MISHYIDIFIFYLNLHAEFFSAYFPILVFLSALIESSPGFGTVTPGTLLLLFFGFSAYNLHINLSLFIIAATVGSVMGDVLGYLLGKYGSSFLIKHKKLLKASHIEEGRKFFSSHGVKSIFIGRFIGPLRPIIPLIAGSISMRFSKFIYYDIAASFIWSVLYLVIGYYFGGYFRQIERFVTHTSMILGVLVLAWIIVYYFKNKKNKGTIKTDENS